MGNGTSTVIRGRGNVSFLLENGKSEEVSNVDFLFVPEKNLLSMRRAFTWYYISKALARYF